MGLFRRNVPIHYIPVHPDNITKKDWIILLEAGTIVGPSAEKLRVALATLEKKIVTKYNIFLKPEHFLVLEGYDPRIHALYYCPQLYKYDGDKKLVPLEGEEIGRLVAKAVQNGQERRTPCQRHPGALICMDGEARALPQQQQAERVVQVGVGQKDTVDGGSARLERGGLQGSE